MPVNDEDQADYEHLKLKNQICFPVYAASRLITREYQPHLDKMGITYPQYLVLMVLWETDNISVKEIAQRLILNTNTLTPLLKRMEAQGVLFRQRAVQDERKVMIQLTEKGKQMRLEASSIPQKLVAGLMTDSITADQIMELRYTLNLLIGSLAEKNLPE